MNSGSPRRAGLAGIITALGLLAAAAPAAASVSLTATDSVVGQPIQATAQLTGVPVDATGTISFEVFGPGDEACSSPLSPAPDPAPVAGEGSYDSGPFTPTSPGTYSWIATYSDGVNPPESTPCTAASTVGKASPQLAGTATSAVIVGQTITDSIDVSGGFAPTGQLTFRAFGPDDPACAGSIAYQAQVSVSGNGSYAPAGFAPPPGLYHWTVEYAGDPNNLTATSPCGATNQASAVGVIDITLSAGALGGTVGVPLSATATIAAGAIPGGQLTFKAFLPGDTSCSGAAAFTTTATVAGNGTYRSAAFAPSRTGVYRWTVAYSGDPNHAPASVACGLATSTIGKASPTIAGKVGRKLTVGTRFRDTVTLAGGFVPTGSITFSIYAPGDDACGKPAFVNTIAVNGSGTYRSDPFVAKRPGRYRFVATYSGDASNQSATEPCGSVNQLALVRKRAPKLRPRALLTGRQISIRARLSGASSPSGLVTFRLYGPNDLRCSGRPAFTGGVRAKANGTLALAEYIATRRGVYRLVLGYSGDARNKRSPFNCDRAQTIVVG